MSTNAMEALIAAYNQEKNPAPKEATGEAKKYLTKDELKKKYFSPQEDTVFFRMTPLPEGQVDHFSVIGHFHEFFINGQTKKLVCLKHYDGSPCPFCEKEAELKTLANDKTLFPDEKKRKELWVEGNKYQAKEFIMLKGIDRGKTGDGTKFWRFKKSFNGGGNKEKLMPAIMMFFEQYKTDIADANSGMDFRITTTNKKMNNGSGTYREITNVMYTAPSPLSHNAEEAQAWTECTLTWKDIYKPTSIRGHLNEYEYLKVVLEGRAPKWDATNRKWMFKDAEGNTYFSDDAPKTGNNSAKSDAVTIADFNDVTTFDSNSNDLPF
jgi:hypothetical protein